MAVYHYAATVFWAVVYIAQYLAAVFDNLRCIYAQNNSLAHRYCAMGNKTSKKQEKPA